MRPAHRRLEAGASPFGVAVVIEELLPGSRGDGVLGYTF